MRPASARYRRGDLNSHLVYKMICEYCRWAGPCCVLARDIQYRIAYSGEMKGLVDMDRDQPENIDSTKCDSRRILLDYS